MLSSEQASRHVFQSIMRIMLSLFVYDRLFIPEDTAKILTHPHGLKHYLKTGSGHPIRFQLQTVHVFFMDPTLPG